MPQILQLKTNYKVYRYNEKPLKYYLKKKIYNNASYT